MAIARRATLEAVCPTGALSYAEPGPRVESTFPDETCGRRVGIPTAMEADWLDALFPRPARAALSRHLDIDDADPRDEDSPSDVEDDAAHRDRA